MRHKPLPPELAHFSHLPDLQFQGGGEWSAACPVCGGAGSRHDASDRFRLFAADATGNARVWCRQCGHFEWADADSNQRPSEQEIEQYKKMRIKLAQRERERTEQKIKELQQSAYWQGWHDAMTDTQREYWRRAGIPDSLQDWFKLGFVEDRTFSANGEPFHSPAMTIPHFDVGWKAVNVQYRIVNPPAGIGKYRYTAGLPAPLFLTEPDKEIGGRTLLVEGAKKAIVTWAHVGSELNVIAVPSKAPGQNLIERLANCEEVYLAMDPDAYVVTRSNGKMIAPAINRIAKMLRGRSRIVKLPVKPDDLFTLYGGNKRDFMAYVNQAVRA